MLSEVIELYFNSKELQDFLSSLPVHTRTWNSNLKCWAVIPEILHKIISYGRYTFNRIDSSSLPIHYQSVVQRALQGLPDTEIYTNRKSSPYSVLYISKGAPECVVKAAYKALAFKYHPDMGGDAEEFQKVKAAYDEIMKKP